MMSAFRINIYYELQLLCTPFIHTEDIPTTGSSVILQISSQLMYSTIHLNLYVTLTMSFFLHCLIPVLFAEI